jgi:ubiquinol-cytochrome c reductase subunit 8
MALNMLKSNFVSVSALIVAYLVYEGVEREHHRLGRKNPADFENDQ